MVKKFLILFSPLLIYFLVTFLSINMTNWWWVWSMLEMMNWSFMFFIKNFNLMVMFLMWQSLSSLLFLLSFLILKKKMFIFLSMLLKMSLPPFHVWFWSVLNMWEWKSIILFLNLHKYPSMMVLINFMMSSAVQLLIFMPIIVFMNFWVNSSFKSFVWIISINDSCWLILSYYMMLQTFVIYLMMNLMFMMMMMTMNIGYKIKMNLMIYLILMMMALPPFPSFQMKWLIMSVFSLNLSLFLIFNLIIFFFLMFWMIFSVTILNKYEMNTSDFFLSMMALMMVLWLLFV